MITFSMDESGYTGYDLLHKEQKFQGASSILINHDDASRLIKEYFPKLQGKVRISRSFLPKLTR